MKDYIVKTTRSLQVEWNSRNILYSLHNGFQVVYLFDAWKHGSHGGLNWQEASIKLIQRNERYHTEKGKSFLWMVAVFENEFYYLSFFMLSNRNQN